MKLPKIHVYAPGSIKIFHGFSRFYKAVENECEEDGFKICFIDSDLVSPKDYVEYCNRSRHATLVWSLDVFNEIEFIREAIRNDISFAMVMYNSVSHSTSNINSVSIDYISAVKDLTFHLIKTGRRRIAFLGLNNSVSVDAAKVSGYRLGLQENSLGFSIEDVFTYGNRNIYDAINQLLDRIDKYNAVVCSTDAIAMLLMFEAENRGICIPDQLAITGFDDNILGRIVAPKLTTVRLDYASLGRVAANGAKILYYCHQISSMKIHTRYDLVIRESSGAGNPGSSLLQQAKLYNEPGYENYIREPFKCFYHFNDIADSLASKRILYSHTGINKLEEVEQLFSHLSQEELIILEMLFNELKYKDMAKRLYISEPSVKYRIKVLAKKFGCRNSRHLLTSIRAMIGNVLGDNRKTQG